MRYVKTAIALLVALTVLMAGCLGSGDEGGGNEIQYVEARGMTGAEGAVEVSVDSPDPVPASESVNLVMPEDNITGVNLVIKVMDASGEYSDDQTKQDDVSGSLDAAGGGYNETLQKGQTTYTKTISIKSQDGRSLPSQWTLSLDVVCNSGDDQWPGPLIVRYYPDHGFSYNVTVTYTYLTPAET